ncbi:MAG: hypothetical protein L0287_13105 [Anaerolineae bacterium]|nr:hypothetical protein [Anaerolineae bacterium]
MKTVHRTFLFILSLMLTNCASPAPAIFTPVATDTAISTQTSTPEPLTLGAGFRFSTYGINGNPGPEYWLSVGEQMSARFPESHPETIWIVGEFYGGGKTYLSFNAETEDPNVVSGYVDMNKQTLDLFDQNGFKVWLQVEPANADMITLIDLVMNQYKHHPSVLGFGVDVEWYKSDGSPLGTPITDEEAEAWVKAIRAHNPNYWLFLKHWQTEFMPPTYRDGIVFIDDGQQYESFEEIVNEFSAWGEHFAPAPVGFQYGYQSDQIWWKELQDPPSDIGNALLENIPNTTSLFWVDFTIKEIFPP